MTVDSLKGKLLVAAPMLTEPTFARTVVLLLGHGEDGAAGVILNRPSETPVIDALPGWADVAVEPARVFVGGPVQPAAAVGLARVAGESAEGAWEQLWTGLGTIDLERDPDTIGGVEAVRVFAGYSGWSEGQLESELREGAWFVVDALPGDAFTSRPETMWSDVLRRQRGNLKLVATFPPDPSLN